MAAHMVSSEHINVLVWAANRYSDGPVFYYQRADRSTVYINRGEGQNEAGQMLLDTNAASLNRVYGDELEVTYSYQNPASMFWAPVEILKAIRGYIYQACDAADWDTSDAKAFCDKLMVAVLHYLPGYEDAAWCIERDTVPVGD
ncbi:hypothetical protein [Nesterenkonia sp. CF4.4]|uniref:hypothetical protein n=1 Tax=Nesterenkonia sp. CF4.4 TaxID=3373079 RepID=UPI003EE70932